MLRPSWKKDKGKGTLLDDKKKAQRTDANGRNMKLQQWFGEMYGHTGHGKDQEGTAERSPAAAGSSSAVSPAVAGQDASSAQQAPIPMPQRPPPRFGAQAAATPAPATPAATPPPAGPPKSPPAGPAKAPPAALRKAPPPPGQCAQPPQQAAAAAPPKAASPQAAEATAAEAASRKAPPQAAEARPAAPQPQAAPPMAASKQVSWGAWSAHTHPRWRGAAVQRSRRQGRIGQFHNGKKAMCQSVARSLRKRPHLRRVRPDFRCPRTSSSTTAWSSTMMRRLVAGRGPELASTVHCYGGGNRSFLRWSPVINPR